MKAYNSQIIQNDAILALKHIETNGFWGAPMLRNPRYLHRLRVNTSCALRRAAAREKTILLDAMAEASILMKISQECPKNYIIIS